MYVYTHTPIYMYTCMYMQTCTHTDENTYKRFPVMNDRAVREPCRGTCICTTKLHTSNTYTHTHTHTGASHS